jgi:dTDP-glucose 4,6-dehydratase
MDIRKAEAELGWTPCHSLESGLRLTIEWYLAHPEWVAAVRGQRDYQTWIEHNYEKRGDRK